MSAVYVVRYLLANSMAVTAIVPATSIFSGDIPQKTPIPSILITQVSGNPLNFIRNNSRQTQTDGIRVSVSAHDYATVKSLMPLILAAVRGQRGTVNGFSVIDIRPDFQGPDFYDSLLNVHTQNRDLLVRWTQ